MEENVFYVRLRRRKGLKKAGYLVRRERNRFGGTKTRSKATQYSCRGDAERDIVTIIGNLAQSGLIADVMTIRQIKEYDKIS